MSLPESVRREVEAALARGGRSDPVERATRVGGGCINNGARIDTRAGRAFFVKWNARAPSGMFAAEADGLTALREPGALVVPEPLAWGGGAAGPLWLVMDHIERGPGARDADERLGRGLASLHAWADAERPTRADAGDAAGADAGGTAGADAGRGRHAAGGYGPTDNGPARTFGWRRDNWIGSLPQANDPADSWADFWRDRRIEPQLRIARGAGRLGDALFDRLLDAVPRALDGGNTPCLLHGDLWSGNVFTSPVGEPVLIDPAVYRGDGEVDLAMSELFGGFGRRFYDAYDEARGISEAYGSHRRALYQLYYLLVHVNLFGASYVAGSRRAAEQVLAAVG